METIKNSRKKSPELCNKIAHSPFSSCPKKMPANTTANAHEQFYF